MNFNQIRSYDEWIGKSPAQILIHVANLGGWKAVFPTDYSVSNIVRLLWASRVRNFFNIRPKALTLLGIKERGRAKRRAGITFSNMSGSTKWGGFSGDVYKDERHRHWFEMSTIAGVYHSPGKVDSGKIVGGFVALQKNHPFKLVHPDGTGGSHELILRNTRRESEIGKEGETVTIVPEDPEILPEHKGSYNYSDSGVLNRGEHEFRDVAPHCEHAGFYVNPDPISMPIEKRRFPRADFNNHLIADSNLYWWPVHDARFNRIISSSKPTPVYAQDHRIPEY